MNVNIFACFGDAYRQLTDKKWKHRADLLIIFTGSIFCLRVSFAEDKGIGPVLFRNA